LHLVIGIPVKGRVDDLVGRVSAALDIRMEPHQSLYFGGDYWFCGQVGNEELYLFENRDVLDGERFYDDKPPCRFILRVDRTDRDPDTVVEAVSSALGVTCHLFRQQAYPSKGMQP